MRTSLKNLPGIAILLFITFGSPAFSQTLELEYKSMMDRYLAMEFTQLEFKDLSFAWRDLMDSCFPISKNEQDEWKAIITLVNETRESLKAMIALLEDYIKDYENDYSW